MPTGKPGCSTGINTSKGITDDFCHVVKAAHAVSAFSVTLLIQWIIHRGRNMFATRNTAQNQCGNTYVE